MLLTVYMINYTTSTQEGSSKSYMRSVLGTNRDNALVYLGQLIGDDTVDVEIHSVTECGKLDLGE